MDTFIYNLIIATLAFSSWYLVGLGPTLALLPRIQRREAFLLAPVIGMCSLILMGFFEISILLTPIVPHFNFILLATISLICCFIIRRSSIKENILYKPEKSFAWLLIPSLALLLIFAWLFHHSGFHLLVGSSDQLQYCLNAKQILEEMHTGSPNDLPIPRYDHFVYEMVTRIQPYLKTWRRGAEVMLATMTSLTRLTEGEAFPVTILSALITLGLTLSYLGRNFFKISTLACLVLQITFFSSFYLLLLHVQGSLAMILAMTPGLLALALLVQVVYTPSWRWIVLSAIVIAGYFCIYCEPSTINVILPSLLLIAWECYRSWSSGFATLKRLTAVYVLALIIAPYAFYVVILSFTGNFLVVFSNWITLLSTTSTTTVKAISLDSITHLWSLATVILGSNSYYDRSSINAAIAVFSSKAPWIGLVEFLAVGGFAILGYIKARKSLGFIYAIILIIWATVSPILALQQDYLRFARSIHYTLPFAMIGLVLLASQNNMSSSRKKIWVALTWIGRVFLIAFIFINLCTSIRTIYYLASHDVTNDPIILHFNERSPDWQNLKKELQTSARQNIPVLFSGFTETIRPLAIASVIPDIRQVVGDSLSKLWQVYSLHRSERDFSNYNVHLPDKQLVTIQQEEDTHWTKSMVPNLVKLSEQAIIPVGHGYPDEWISSKDVYPPLIKHFATICDVVYRKQFSIELANNMTSAVKKDNGGLFRILSTSGLIITHDHPTTAQQLTLKYDGPIDSVKLRVHNQLCPANVVSNKGHVILTATIQPEDITALSLIIKNTVKLRSITMSKIITELIK